MARLGLIVGVSVVLLAGCGGDDFEDTSPGQNGGAAGEAGSSGGSAGVGGSSGVGGAAGGSAGTGGQAPGCPAGKADCDGKSSNGCEVTLGTADNCGSCGDKCAGDTTCKDSTCQIQCPAGKGDCDSNAANGCEAELTTDEANCGGCKKACAAADHASVTCENSSCKLECTTGFADCDKNATNGCEADQANDIEHCGGCVPCVVPPHAKPTCKDFFCGYECDAGWENCDGDDKNGCESEIATNTSHCGGCGKLCGDSNGTPSCVDGKCQFACNTGFANCDGIDTTGCETSLGDPKNCGSCGHDCKTSACNSSMMCEPISLGQNAEVGSHLAHYQTKLFWLSESSTSTWSIQQMPKTGGTPTALGTGAQPLMSALLVEATGAYVVAQADARVLKTPLTGGQSVVVGAPTGGLSGSGLALSSQYAFWFSIDGGKAKLYRSLKTGSSPVLVVTDDLAKTPSGVTADEQAVYWSDATAGLIQTVSHTGTGRKTLAAGQTGARDLTADADNLYWATGSNGAVAMVSKSGGAVTTLATHAGEYLAGLVFDAGFVWYASSSEKIRRVPKTGGTSFVMAQGQSGLGSITGDGEYIYWLRYDNDVTSVYKVAGGP